MTHRILTLALLAGLLVGLAAPAAAQDAPPAAPEQPADAPQAASLELSASADPAEVKVGEAVTITVMLKNTGSSQVSAYRLHEDRQLVSFDVQLDDGRVFRHEKIHPSVYAPRTDWPTGELAAGESWELAVKLPALTAGKLTVTAHYGRQPADGLKSPPKHLTAKPVTVTLVPNEGAEEVAVRLRTNLGPMRLRLFPREALGTALHFARLIVEGAEVDGQRRAPFYEGLTFHRVIPRFVIQGGCPLGTGMGGPGYTIPGEHGAPKAGEELHERRRHVPGRLAMARTGHDDSAGSQFYICVGTTSDLDTKYTVFGEVTRGMDVAYTIAEVATAKEKPLEDVVIQDARLVPAKPKTK